MAKKIIFGLSGSIACYKATEVISKLIQKENEVQCIATENAIKFIGKATLEGLTKRQLLYDMFEKEVSTRHIELSNWGDIMIICPATANIINKLACGIADDYLTTTFLSFDISKKPVIIFPAMNENMYRHPITQSSIKRLRELGLLITRTGTGYLACGQKGEGRLLEVSEIMEIIEKYL